MYDNKTTKNVLAPCGSLLLLHTPDSTGSAVWCGWASVCTATGCERVVVTVLVAACEDACVRSSAATIVSPCPSRSFACLAAKRRASSLLIETAATLTSP